MTNPNLEAVADRLNMILAMLCDRELCGHFTAEEIRYCAESALKLLSSSLPASGGQKEQVYSCPICAVVGMKKPCEHLLKSGLSTFRAAQCERGAEKSAPTLSAVQANCPEMNCGDPSECKRKGICRHHYREAVAQPAPEEK